uniref:hypothetical protein n=1 Tax=Methanobrevibacter sp. TaxID=66852 RepID=UPI00386FD86A
KPLEGTDFVDELASDKRFIFDSVLASKDHDDFDKLREFYSIIHSKLSDNDEVSAIREWFESIDEEYKSQVYGSVKFRLKRFKNKELDDENELFCRTVLNHSDYINHATQPIIHNIDSLLDELIEISDKLNQNNESSKIADIHGKIKSEFQLFLEEYKSNYAKLNEYKYDINNKNDLISNLNDEVEDYKSSVAEKDAIISDLSDDISDYVSVIRKSGLEVSKLKSENSYLENKNKSLIASNSKLKGEMENRNKVKQLFSKISNK